MTSESSHNCRLNQAESFGNEELQTHSPRVFANRLVSQFIMEGVTGPNIISQSMTANIVTDSNATEVPTGWLFAVPGLARCEIVSVRFGTGTPELKDPAKAPQLLRPASARFAKEMRFDDDIMKYKDNPMVRELFLRIGGPVVEHVKHNGGVLFSGLERRVRLNTDGSRDVWTQLIYAREILGANRWVERYISEQHKNGKVVPSWLHQAARPQRSRSVANVTALSALYALSEPES